MNLRTLLTASAASLTLAIAIATPAYAQSTGSQEFNREEIIVTGARVGPLAVEGVAAPESTKAAAILTQDVIQYQSPGQTILDTINLIPGVSFQNNDAYGSSGGTLNIRGFDSSRVALLFDGIPTNDTGNYALYSNQQLDSELISQVKVNIGTTDVDSPTPSAVGGTINYISKNPDHNFGAMLSGTAGQFDMLRMFGKIETGDLTESGVRAWVAVSKQTYNNPFNNYGKVNKFQANAKLYVPLSGGDFISISGHWNKNRNNFFGSLPLRWDTAGRVVGSGSGNRYPINADERQYNINYPCTTVDGGAGAQTTNSCGTEFDRRYNPSDTGNLRINSRFTLSPTLVLTVDPYYQYVKANGGGTVTGIEGTRTVGGKVYTGFIGGSYYFGKDLNGDGDTLDRVTLLAPSETQTHRIGVSASLKWDITPTQAVRLAYSYDRGRHRQTGEVASVNYTGEPNYVFPVDGALSTSGGFLMQKRDRLSYAILHQIAAEYRGEFMDGALTINGGIRAPFFKRNLNNYCFTTSASGFLDCIGNDPATIAAYAAANPYSYDSATSKVTGYAAPQKRVYNYNKILPSIGFDYKFGNGMSVFGNYSKGLSVPGTDNLYNAFYFPVGTAQATPAPETTDNFDFGGRYRSGRLQAQIAGFYTQFHNRLASAYDPELNTTVYRNLGNVRKYGFDGFVSFDIVPDKLNLYLFGSLLRSEIQNDIQIGTVGGVPIYAGTKGTFESGAPKSTFGVSVRGHEGPFSLGITAKRTGQRYVYDNNQATYVGSTSLTGGVLAPSSSATKIFPASVPAYWLVNLDARVKLTAIGLNDKSFLQLNVYNLFDKFYVGGFGGNLTQTISGASLATYGSPGFVQIGAPRTISGSVTFAF